MICLALVRDSGTKEGSSIEVALGPVRERQQAALAAYELEAANYLAANQLYEREHANWKKFKSMADPPAAPQRPELPRTWVDKTTVADKHYRTVPESSFRRAAGLEGASPEIQVSAADAVQNATQ